MQSMAKFWWALLVALRVLGSKYALAAVFNKDWKVPITLSDTANVGDTIIWTWADTAPHDIQFLTFPAGFTGLPTNNVVGLTVPPQPLRAPYSVRFTPSLPGTYTYVCTVHASMTGTFVVAAPKVAVTITKGWRVPVELSDTINVGDTVIWTWLDTAPHDIQFLTFPAGFTGIATNGVVGLTVPPAPVRAPYNVSFTPTVPGTYTYVCTVHASMTGTLVVADSNATVSGPPPVAAPAPLALPTPPLLTSAPVVPTVTLTPPSPTTVAPSAPPPIIPTNPPTTPSPKPINFSPPAPSPNSDDGNGLSTGVVVGVPLAALAVLAAGLLALWAIRKKRRRQPPNEIPDLYGVGDVEGAGGSPKAPVAPQPKPRLASAAVEAQQALGAARNFSYKELKKATKGFSLNTLIGEGGFGRVYRATFVGESVLAVKELRKGKQGVGQKDFVSELATISNVRHRNLVCLRGYCIGPTAYFLVMDYAPNGNLFSALHSGVGLSLSWSQRLNIALGAARGLSYLHNDMAPSILHRDIKSANILLDANMDPLVADFGLAKLLKEGMTHQSTMVRGTYGYVAPEYALYGNVTRMSDVYSFGVVLMELVTGRRAVETMANGTRCNLVDAVESYRDQPHVIVDPRLQGQFPPHTSTQVIALAIACTSRQETQRPSMSQTLRGLEDLSQNQEPNGGIFNEEISRRWFGEVTSLQPAQRTNLSSSTNSWSNKSSSHSAGPLGSMDFQVSAITQGR